jgi:hypothetical protein
MLWQGVPKMGKKKGGFSSAFVCAGLAVAVTAVLDFMWSFTWNWLLGVVAAYLVYGRGHRVQLVWYAVAYVVMYVLLAFTILGSLVQIFTVI